MNSFCYFFRRK